MILWRYCKFFDGNKQDCETPPGRRISMEVFVAAAQTLCGRAREQRSPKRYPGNLQKTHNYSRNPNLSCLSLKKIVLDK